MFYVVFPGLLLWIPSDQPGKRRWGKNCIHYPVWSFLLDLQAVRPQERWSDLPESHSNMLSRSLGQESRSLCWWCGDQNRKLRKLHWRFAVGHQQPEAIPVEAQSRKMSLECQQGSYLDSLLATEGLKLTRKRLRLSWGWKHHSHRRKCKDLLGAWQLEVGSY